MNKFTLYLLRSFLYLFAICLIGSVLIFVVLDFVGNSREWMKRPPAETYQYYLNYTPQIIFLILPIALLLATVFSVGALARHLELVALRSAGFSIYRILMPLFLFGALVSVGMFYFGDRITPKTNHALFQIKEPKNPDYLSGDPTERYNYIFNGSGGTTYFFRYFSGKRLIGQGITILRKSGDSLTHRYDAKSITYDNSWKLIDGAVRQFTPDGVQTETFRELRVHELVDSPSDIIHTKFHPDEMSLKEIREQMGILERSGEPTHFLETHFHFRYSAPVVNFVMILLGISISAHAVRKGLARNFGVALLLTFMYYVALRLGLVMGYNGGLPPVTAAWFGNILFVPVALLLLWRMGRT